MRRLYLSVMLLVACDGPAPADAPTMGPEPETPQRPTAAPSETQENSPAKPLDSEAPAPQEPVAQEPTVPSPMATPSGTARPMPQASVDTPNMPIGGTGEPVVTGPTIVAGSATAPCREIGSSTLTIGEGDAASTTRSSAWYALLSVPGMTRENFVSGHAELSEPLTPTTDPCGQYDEAGIPCTHSSTGEPAPSSILFVGLSDSDELFVYCGRAGVTATFWYRYLE